MEPIPVPDPEGRGEAGPRRTRFRKSRTEAAIVASLLVVVVEEPLLVQRVDGAIVLHRLDGGVDWRDEVGALLEDEAELLRLHRIADDLERVRRGAHVAGGR